jgi:hypothetical protein
MVTHSRFGVDDAGATKKLLTPNEEQLKAYLRSVGDPAPEGARTLTITSWKK